MDKINVQEITIDGTVYVPKGAELKPNGKRAVVVVDRGWIFAGDVTEENGRIKLTRAVWVFRWESIGFDGMLNDPKSGRVTLRKLGNAVDIPSAAEVFRVPVADDWGI